MTRISVLFQPIIQRIADYRREQRIKRMSSKLSYLASGSYHNAADKAFKALALEIAQRSVGQVRRMEKKGGLI